MAIETTTERRVAGGTVQTSGAASTVGGSGPGRGPSPRRLRLFVVLAVLALVAVLGGAILSMSLTRSPAGPAPARPAVPAQINPTGDTPNEREGRIPSTVASPTGETPNEREGRIPECHAGDGGHPQPAREPGSGQH